MKFLLNTGRTVPQGDAVERKYSGEYELAVSVCFLNPVDMMDLFVEDGDPVRIWNGTGSVVLRCSPSDAVRSGSAFIPLGPFANYLVPAMTHSTGMPDYKTTPVEIEPTSEPLSTIANLVASYGGLFYDG